MVRLYRELQKEPLNGVPVEGWTRVGVRRKLIGRTVEWHRTGWSHKHTGVVQETDNMGHNVLVSGNYEWAPDMKNVHVLPEGTP